MRRPRPVQSYAQCHSIVIMEIERESDTATCASRMEDPDEIHEVSKLYIFHTPRAVRYGTICMYEWVLIGSLVLKIGEWVRGPANSGVCWLIG